jgi:hypothetical protein
MDCWTYLITLIGTLILLVPTMFGFAIGWIGVSLIGMIMFTFFSIAAIFMDTVRWAVNNFREPNKIPASEQTTRRLQKAMEILIVSFQIMGDLPRTDGVRQPLLNNTDVDVERGRVPTAQAVRT